MWPFPVRTALLSFFSLLSLPVFSLPVFSLPVFAGTPVPKVTGPLPITATSYPFGAAGHERVPEGLKSIGYVEEEYLISGTANVYDWPAPGPAVVRTPNAPWTTRVLVRRPASKARFSGTVAVEMANPSNLFDLNLGWTINHREFARNGDAWVMITAKPVSVVTLKSFNPERYVAVSWANPVPVDDPKNCPTVPADSTRTTENGLVWDIYTQTGAWLRSAGASESARLRRDRCAQAARAAALCVGLFADRLVPLHLHQRHSSARREGKPQAHVRRVSDRGGQRPVGDQPVRQCRFPRATRAARSKTRAFPSIRVMSQSDYLIRGNVPPGGPTATPRPISIATTK